MHASALTLTREVGDRQSQAYVLNLLGEVQASTLGPADGLARQIEALSIYQRIESHSAQQVQKIINDHLNDSHS